MGVVVAAAAAHSNGFAVGFYWPCCYQPRRRGQILVHGSLLHMVS